MVCILCIQWHLEFFFSDFGVFWGLGFLLFVLVLVFFSFEISLMVKKKLWYIKTSIVLWLLFHLLKPELSISGGTVWSVTSSLLSWLLFQFCFIPLPHLLPLFSTVMFKGRYQTSVMLLMSLRSFLIIAQGNNEIISTWSWERRHNPLTWIIVSVFKIYTMCDV